MISTEGVPKDTEREVAKSAKEGTKIAMTTLGKLSRKCGEAARRGSDRAFEEDIGSTSTCCSYDMAVDGKRRVILPL